MAGIDHNDTKPIDDMLRSIGKPQTIELIIHSAGGLAENAKKIVSLIRSSNCKKFKVIVPDAAKSAATIIALGSDKIIMSDTSELGPIDPQILQPTPQGFMMRPAWAIVKIFNDLIEKSLREDGSLNPAYIPILSSFDVSLLKYCETAIENSKKIAEEYLKKWNVKGGSGKSRTNSKRFSLCRFGIYIGNFIVALHCF